MIDLDGLSLEEMKKLEKDLARAIAGFEKRRKKQALEEMKAVAEKHGLTFSEVMTDKGVSTKGSAKYANPEDALQTWTGRGRKPAWFTAAIAAGKTPEDMEL